MVPNRNGMKDLSEYILFIVEGCGIPVFVKLTKEGSYVVTVTKDLKYSSTLYKISISGVEPNIMYVRNQLKKYLSHLDIVVNMEYINYPEKFREIKKMYKYELS
jgi:hypothetical protein